MAPEPHVVWLRHDLRIADNPALDAAWRSGAPVIPCFIWSPNEEAPWAPGAATRWWLHHALRQLAEAMQARGGRLVIRQGPTLATLRAVCQEAGARAVHWNRRYEPAIVARDTAIKSALTADGIAAHSYQASLLCEPWELHTQQGRPFQVFTPFWKRLHAQPIAPPLPAPTGAWPTPASWPRSDALESCALLPCIAWDAGLRDMWQPGEAGAQQQLHRFIDCGVAQYHAQRDFPSAAVTSRLAPYLRCGELSPRQVWHALADLPGAEPFLRQLAWREFAYHLLYHFPTTPADPLRPAFARFPWRNDPEALRAWQQGRTGYPLVDAGMRELWHTGTMHNRVRMVAASFLTKHLLIPWQSGAAWFWDTLVDADLANNTLGWQWVAGCGADAAPYFRIFHPTLQSQKFDPDGAYARRWIPELDTGDYPPPMLDHKFARERALAAYATIK